MGYLSRNRGGGRRRGRPRARLLGSRSSGSNAGLIVGLLAGGGVLLAVVVIVVAQRQAAQDKAQQKADAHAMFDGVPEEAPPPPVVAAEEPREEKKGAPSMRKVAKHQYEVPDEFEAGAAQSPQARNAVTPDKLGVEDGLIRVAEEKLIAGQQADLVQNEGKYIGAVVCCMLSDDPTAARGAFQFMHDFCTRHHILNEETQQNPVELKYFNSAYWRGGEYDFWSGWYRQNRYKFDSSGGTSAPLVGMDPRTADWDRLMKQLRAGGAFDDPDRPEGQAFQKVKAMGRGAYPYLVKYIDHEDTMLGRSAVTVLNQLTGRTSSFDPANKERLRKEWEAWVEKN